MTTEFDYDLELRIWMALFERPLMLGDATKLFEALHGRSPMADAHRDLELLERIKSAWNRSLERHVAVIKTGPTRARKHADYQHRFMALRMEWSARWLYEETNRLGRCPRLADLRMAAYNLFPNGRLPGAEDFKYAKLVLSQQVGDRIKNIRSVPDGSVKTYLEGKVQEGHKALKKPWSTMDRIPAEPAEKLNPPQPDRPLTQGDLVLATTGFATSSHLGKVEKEVRAEMNRLADALSADVADTKVRLARIETKLDQLLAGNFEMTLALDSNLGLKLQQWLEAHASLAAEGKHPNIRPTKEPKVAYPDGSVKSLSEALKPGEQLELICQGTTTVKVTR